MLELHGKLALDNSRVAQEDGELVDALAFIEEFAEAIWENDVW